MIIDGYAVAERVYASLEPELSALGRPVRLGIVFCGDDPVIASFIRIKKRAAERLGIALIERRVSAHADTGTLVQETERAAGESDGVIVQLPLPSGVDTEAVLAAIPIAKDVDAIHPNIHDDERPVQAPVALAVLEILSCAGIDPRGMRVAVVGEGRLVGRPVAGLFSRRGARVSVISKEQGDPLDLRDADIVVLGAGDPGFLKPYMMRRGVILIDAGTSEAGGKVMGDADPACAEAARIFTPVPGGVGPVAVSMIFKNLLELARQAHD